MTWCVLGLLVVVIAGFDGGPKSIDDWTLSHLLGSNPSGEDPTEPLPDCNARSVGWGGCDKSVNGNPCGPGRWVAISATKGGINNKRHDPDFLCSLNAYLDCEKTGAPF